MKFIGITGGIGAGKSVVLKYLSERPGVRVLYADEIAKELMRPGHICYNKLKIQFPDEDIYQRNGSISDEKLAEMIFSNAKKREELNAIVHPAVKAYVNEQRRIEYQKNELDYLFLEAALLVEEHYETICDEMWYVYAGREKRRERLKSARGYSDERIESIFSSQLGEQDYRSVCNVTIDNSGTLAETYEQVEDALRGNKNMEKVFGLDIGTRNVVGTVGYKTEDEEFVVLAQHSRQHEKRAMLDGQIHDIGRVARTIGIVKAELERQIGEPLTEVCIAAAGRVLKTVTTHIEYEYPEESVVTDEDIHTLDLLGIEKAQDILKEKNDTNYKFYCVGYSVVKYFINDEVFISIEGHKADKIGEDIIVTFLPEDVVDGLYAAVGQVGLSVANMTLEPIAAINVAIPENFRMLNIALVDVGAGTSDISITRDGSIIAYGMIPDAGDELTEQLVQHYLVDFMTAEQMKLTSTTQEKVVYKDIMSIEHTIPAQEIWDLLEPHVDRITTEVAAKIRELNGDQTVSACFVVGGGGKVHGYTEMLAEKLDLPNERVALRGEEVLQEVIFRQPEVKKDPLIVTPVGICLNYYDQKNNFIMVRFNGERMKLYDNNRLTIVDAALQAGFPNDQLFPKRGVPINFMVNGVSRIVRGEAGEPAVVTLNGRPANINTPLEPNCEITIEPSTAGEDAVYTIAQLDEYTTSVITFQVNGQWISCPKFVEVNGSLEPETYRIREGDVVETRSFYTVGQVAEFMDVIIDENYQIMVNNRPATLDSLVYENFSVEWTTADYSNLGYRAAGYDVDSYARQQAGIEISGEQYDQSEAYEDEEGALVPEEEPAENPGDSYHSPVPQEGGTDSRPGVTVNRFGPGHMPGMSTPEPRVTVNRFGPGHMPGMSVPEPEVEEVPPEEPVEIMVTVNGEEVTLTGKSSYIFVDIFDRITFDLKAGEGRAIVTLVNGHEAQYAEEIHNGDKIELYWKED